MKTFRLMILKLWRRQRSLFAPSTPETFLKHRFLEAEFLRPLNKGLSFSVESQKAVVSLVAALLRACCPVAIFLTISLVVVFSLNRILPVRLRLWPHIVEEILKRLGPSWTDRYAATAIEMINVAFMVRASDPDVDPRSVFNTVCHSMRRCDSRLKKTLAMTPARNRASVEKATVDYFFLGSAFTANENHSILRRVITFADYRKFAKDFADVFYTCVSHCVSLPLVMRFGQAPFGVLPSIGAVQL